MTRFVPNASLGRRPRKAFVTAKNGRLVVPFLGLVRQSAQSALPSRHHRFIREPVSGFFGCFWGQLHVNIVRTVHSDGTIVRPDFARLLVSDFFAHGPDNALPVARVLRRHANVRFPLIADISASGLLSA